ncbi:MAG: S-adenosylmethionine:tRNA ribosyltransferase-isomerase, partial [Planctomycetia bacterium]|nr:S-adenosylmethionine:tRNA ribosyltransferase-isomerase [Planctomycetia bacterium]
MDVADFDYELPEAAIAQHPIEPRDAARLLVDTGPGTPPQHRHVRDLPDLLEPGDLLVVNTTRVLPARLMLRKSSGGAVEVLLLERLDAGSLDDPGSSRWEALVRPGRKVPPGTVLRPDDDPGLTVTAHEDLGDGRRAVTIESVGPLAAALERCGTMPLPPYLTA